MKPKHFFDKMGIPLVIMVFLGFGQACKVVKPYQSPSRIAGDRLYRGMAQGDTATMASLSWKELFKDSLLQQLIDEGISQNTDLQIALARMKSSSAVFRQSKLNFFPALNLNGAASFQEVAPSQFGFPQFYQLSLSSSWMADIWGQLSSAKKAALAALLQSEAYRRTVQTQLVASIAYDYYLLLALDAELKITERTLELRKEEVETMKILKESDVVTGAAVVQSTANRYSVEITIPDLRQNIRETENAISILLGRAPDTVMRSHLEDQQFNAELKTGVPAQLLANRPDVQEAELQFRNAFELVNVARTYFYPSLNITASSGYTGIVFSQLINPASFFASLTGSLLQPVFSQGQNKLRLAAAQAKAEEYFAGFKHALLNAGQEVSNALYSYQTALEKENLRSQQIAFLQKSVDYTKELLKYSSKANYTDVLTSEQGLLAAQLNEINDRLQRMTAIVSLYKSLGGGWK